MRTLLLPALAVGAGVAWMLWPSSAAASTGGSSSSGTTPDTRDLDYSQTQIIAMLKVEALKQGAPVEMVLATAEVESGFRNVKATNGNSYGPMQVHVSALLPGETVSDLQNVSFSIARGVSLLRQRLSKASGDSLLARIMYFCGPGYQTSCSDASIARLKERWDPVAIKWKVATTYRLSGGKWVPA